MQPLRLFAALAAVIVAFAPALAVAEGFLRVPEDVPLAPGLVESPDAGFFFDSPNGRIIKTHAMGPVDAASVYAFYGSTLRQLGWIRVNESLYRRESEKLGLSVSPGNNGLVVHFTILSQ